MKKWLQNFWYYHKVPAVIALVVLAAGIYYFLTLHRSVESDYHAAVVSRQGCTGEQLARIRSVLEGAGKDQNGDGSVMVGLRVFRFAVGEDGQDAAEIAALDADLVGKESGIFFVEDPEKFETAVNGICKASDAVPVSEIPLLSGCGIDDLYLLTRSDAEDQYAEMRSALAN